MNLYRPSNMRVPPPLSLPVAPFDAGPLWKPEPVSVEPAEPEPEPPEIATPVRDTRAEVRVLLSAALEYLMEFSIVEKVDDFERGYRDPLNMAKPPQPVMPPEGEQFESQRQELLTCLETFAATFADFLTAHHDWRVKELREQYGQAWRECRKQRSLLDSLTNEHAEAGNHPNGLKLRAEQSPGAVERSRQCET